MHRRRAAGEERDASPAPVVGEPAVHRPEVGEPGVVLEQDVEELEPAHRWEQQQHAPAAALLALQLRGERAQQRLHEAVGPVAHEDLLHLAGHLTSLVRHTPFILLASRRQIQGLKVSAQGPESKLPDRSAEGRRAHNCLRLWGNRQAPDYVVDLMNEGGVEQAVSFIQDQCLNRAQRPDEVRRSLQMLHDTPWCADKNVRRVHLQTLDILL
mmetsp:Transcript_120967/g.353430  ORF Transcript_120967/g.353430 Transcript_120967/m.353430 type:complete len:212 (-) Transcript_120967:561-1196(-)